MVDLAVVRRDSEARAMLEGAERHLKALGYTEHGFRHAGLVGRSARGILSGLRYPERQCELAAVAGWLHDIGNVVARDGHGLAGAIIAMSILRRLDMDEEEIAEIAGAIGNHEDGEGHPVNPVSAALILADKADVRRTRVRNKDQPHVDIHDRVNFAVTRRRLTTCKQERVVALKLVIDTDISPVMEYFETFLLRMLMCRRAAGFLDASFHLTINETRLL